MIQVQKHGGLDYNGVGVDAIAGLKLVLLNRRMSIGFESAFSFFVRHNNIPDVYRNPSVPKSAYEISINEFNFVLVSALYVGYRF